MGNLINFFSNPFANLATDSRTRPCASPYYGSDTDNTSYTSYTSCSHPNSQANRTTGDSTGSPPTETTQKGRHAEFSRFSKLDLLASHIRTISTHLLNSQH